jgi:hypothetical protein
MRDVVIQLLQILMLASHHQCVSHRLPPALPLIVNSHPTVKGTTRSTSRAMQKPRLDEYASSPEPIMLEAHVRRLSGHEGAISCALH